MRLRTRGALAALPLALALALTGCGGDDGGTGVASADGAGGTPQAEQSVDIDDMAMKFAECMRDHGVPMKDPETSGNSSRSEVKGSDRATMQKAQEACRKYDPMQAAGPPSAEEKERNLEYAECMRQNGVEAFPDPKPNQRGIQISGEVGNDPDFDPAQLACRDVLNGGER